MTKLGIDVTKRYQRLFELTGVPYLVSDILAENYRPLECLFIYCGGIWTSYVPKSVIERTLDEGVEFFSDAEKFGAYDADFGRYREKSEELFKRILAMSEITKKDAEKYLAEVAENHRYYIKTEFFFVDRAFEKSQSNQTIKNNLKELEGLKNTAREYLNKIFFGSEGYLNRFLVKLSGIFGVDFDELSCYSIEEVLDLFDGKTVSAAAIFLAAKSIYTGKRRSKGRMFDWRRG